MNRYERIFKATEGQRLPVRMKNFQISKPFESVSILMFDFSAPCPCKGWKHDTKNFFRAKTTQPDWVTRREQWRFMKSRLREEAAKHATEFLFCGTIDGVKV